MTLTTKLALNLGISSRVTTDLGSDSATRALAIALELAHGTGAGQADLAFTDTRTLAASGTEDHDLAGALAGVEGAAVFARVKILVVTAAAANTNNVVVSRPASNGVPIFSAAGDAHPIRPGGFLAIGMGAADATGIVVTAGTGDLITVTNSAAGTSVDYSIAILGCSA